MLSVVCRLPLDTIMSDRLEAATGEGPMSALVSAFGILGDVLLGGGGLENLSARLPKPYATLR